MWRAILMNQVKYLKNIDKKEGEMSRLEKRLKTINVPITICAYAELGRFCLNKKDDGKKATLCGRTCVFFNPVGSGDDFANCVLAKLLSPEMSPKLKKYADFIFYRHPCCIEKFGYLNSEDDD